LTTNASIAIIKQVAANAPKVGAISTMVKGIKTNLTSLGKEYNIDHEYDKLHNAIVDLRLNLKVWNKLKYQIEI